MKFRALLILLFSCLLLQAQKVMNVHLSDAQKRPISFAIMRYGSLTFSSGPSGVFRITNYQAGSPLTVHKLGFADTTLSISALPAQSDTFSVFLVLRLQPMTLSEVTVRSTAIAEVNPLKAEFILGYELKGEYLLELLSDDILLVTDANHQLKFRSRPIPGAQDIVKDAYGVLHIVTDKCAYRIYPESAALRIDTVPVDLTVLNWNLKYCDEVTDTSVFIRRYKDLNQTVVFFAISRPHPKQFRQLKEITEVARKNAVIDFANEVNSLNRYVASLDLSGGTATTLEEIGLVRKAERMTSQLEANYALPAYSFLKLVNDSIYLFAHDLDSMFVYDQRWNLIKSKRIAYHHLKIWGKALFVNEEKTKVYAKLVDNSKTVIAEIDLQTGTLKPGFTVLETKFPRHIKIRDDVVYYMAKQKSGTGYTVYSQQLRWAGDH